MSVGPSRTFLDRMLLIIAETHLIGLDNYIFPPSRCSHSREEEKGREMRLTYRKKEKFYIRDIVLREVCSLAMPLQRGGENDQAKCAGAGHATGGGSGRNHQLPQPAISS